jgi:uncharacterized oligopeptide transporter (OPT) family protein
VPDPVRLEVDPTRAATEDPEQVWRREVYRPSEANLTLRAALVGVLVGAAMCLSNVYVFFKTGWSLGVTLTACILAFGTFAGLRAIRLARTPFGALENNALTTVASGAGYMTGGGNMAAYGALLMVLVPPALVPHMWDGLENGFLLSREPQPGPSQYLMMLWFAVIAALGVFVAIPIKRQLINREGVAFPTGTATAATIRSLHAANSREGRSALKGLGIGFAIGAVMKALLDIFKVLPHQIAAPVDLAGYSLYNWSIYLKTEVVLIAAGALMSFRTGWSLLVGGIITYGVLAPWLASQGYIGTLNPDKDNFKEIVKWTLWPGAAILVSAGLVSFALDYKSLARSFRGLGRRGANAPQDALADVESPGWWFPAAFLLLGPIVIFLMGYMFGIPAWAGVLALVLAVFMGFIAARVTGETDITPTKALGPVTQMTFGAVTPGNLHGNIMAANVTGGIGLHAADLLTTLKTGWLLGAKPRHQLYAQLIGVAAGAIFIIPAFEIIIPDPAELGGSEWPAPSCLVWVGVSEAFAGGLDKLDGSIKIAMLVGAIIGTVVALAERFAPARLKAYIPSANGLGISMVIPCANSIAMAIGAAIAEDLKQRNRSGQVVPVASGLIAGESLMGIVFAILLYFGIVSK